VAWLFTGEETAQLTYLSNELESVLEKFDRTNIDNRRSNNKLVPPIRNKSLVVPSKKNMFEQSSITS
jgi:hypothetical protein